jgi:hypothetical protein
MMFLLAASSTILWSDPYVHKGCVWFAFLGQPDSRGAGERRLVAYTTPEPVPASPETPETAVSAEPGSAHAVVSLTNDVLVYN